MKSQNNHFLTCIDGKWWLSQPLTTPVINSDSRPRIERLTTPSIWPPHWHCQIYSKIQQRQPGLSESNRFVQSNSFKIINLSFSICINSLNLRKRHHHRRRCRPPSPRRDCWHASRRQVRRLLRREIAPC